MGVQERRKEGHLRPSGFESQNPQWQPRSRASVPISAQLSSGQRPKTLTAREASSYPPTILARKAKHTTMASSQQQTQSDMSLRLVPGPSGSSSTSVSSTSTAVHAGIHDTLRFGHRNIAHETSAAGSGGHHPLQERLEKWDETRDNLKLTMGRNVYGMGVPLRTMMERKVISYVSKEQQRARARVCETWRY